ncbi:MAG TPA: VOC family protein [Polyangia bacterium]
MDKSPGRAPAAPARKPWLHPPVVHWEIMALDAPRQRAFFSDLFGWAIDANNPQNYGMVPSGGEAAIGGGIGPAPDGKPYVTFYVEVPDIGAALSKAESLGASTVMPRTDMGMVTLAQFRDPEGNLVGLIEASAS